MEVSQSAIGLALHAIPAFQLFNGGDGQTTWRGLEALGDLLATGRVLLLRRHTLVKLLTPHAHFPLGSIALLVLYGRFANFFGLLFGLHFGTGWI